MHPEADCLSFFADRFFVLRSSRAGLVVIHQKPGHDQDTRNAEAPGKQIFHVDSHFLAGSYVLPP